MKKVFLIAAGTVTGLGAVLSITPPVLSNSVGTVGLPGGLDLGGGAATPATPAATPSATGSTASPAAPAATPTKSSTATTAKPTTAATATPTQSAAPTEPAVPATPVVPTGFSGTVNGDAFNARNYGTVSVSATFADGKIKSVSASQSPRSWSQQSLTVLIPYVNAGSITVEQVKAHSAASLPCTRSNSCNSQASYTAEAFWASLKTAITKAGL